MLIRLTNVLFGTAWKIEYLSYFILSTYLFSLGFSFLSFICWFKIKLGSFENYMDKDKITKCVF